MASTRKTAEKVFEQSARLAESMFRDLRDGDFPQTLRRDLRETYDFYLDQDERARLAAMGPWKRSFVSGWLLVKSLFLKLTPVRRLIVAAGTLLAADGAGMFGDPDTMNLAIGFVLLMFVLGLELKDKLLARDELAAGRAVQIALMPEACPTAEGWDLWLHTEPANEVGGDLVDCQTFGDGRFSILLGDVAGKGLGAALFMARLQATVRAIAPSCRSLSEVGARVNEIFMRDGIPGRFASLLYVEADEWGDHLRLMNAGHLPPYVLRAGGVEELLKGSPAIGLSASSRFRESELAMEPGDALVIISDGVTEARDEAGVFYGDDRLRRVLAACHRRPAEEMGRRIVESVALFIGEARPSDDLSVAIIRRRPLVPAETAA